MPEKLITEIPLIARYSRHNEDQDCRFRAYIKLSNLSNAKLDSIVQESTEQVWKQIDCTKCANCCKVLQVVIDDSDIKRLAARVKSSIKAFESKYVSVGRDKVKYFKGQPCPFLGDDNKCQVYEDRPTACHDFPYLHKEDFRSRSLMMLSNLEICPIVFNVWADLKEKMWSRARPRGKRQ